MKYLVTGATGMIGSGLVRHLVRSGSSVAILRRDTSSLDLLSDLAREVDHRIGDVTSPDSLERAFQGIEGIFHVAGHIGFGGKKTQRMLREVNVDGTANVVNAAIRAGINRLVHTSSMAALGRSEDPSKQIDESTEWSSARTNTPYAQSKYLSELEVRRGIAEGLDAVIVNPALVFGECRPKENTRRIAEAVRRRRVPGYPPGGTNVVDVLDVVEGHVAAMERGKNGNRYFLGSENLSWIAIFEKLAQAFGVPPPTRRIPPGVINAAGAVSELWAKISGTQPRISRDMARISASCWQYSNQKAIDELDLRFRSFAETARRLAASMA